MRRVNLHITNLLTSWKNRVTNKEIKVRIGQCSMADNVTLSERKPAGLDIWYKWIISAYLDRCCTGRFRGFKSRPQTSRRSTVNRDLLKMGITWEEAEVTADNRSEW